MRLKSLLSILIASFAALFCPLGPGPALAETSSGFSPVLHVNDSAITGYEVDQRIRFLTLLNFPGDIQAEAESGLIDDRLRQQTARSLGVAVSDQELQGGMSEFAARANLDTTKFLVAIAQGGVDPETFRDFVRAGLAWRGAVRGRFVDQVFATEAEIDRGLSADYGRGEGPRVLISELLMRAGAGEMARTGKLANRLKATIHGEADFARAASENSVAASRADGGKLNWIPLSNLPPQVRDAISTTAQGQVTDPVPLNGYVGLFLVRGLSEGGKLAPANIVVDYAELHLPAGAGADLTRIRAASPTCDDLYTAAHGLPANQLQRHLLRHGQIAGSTGATLDRLDPNETATLTYGDGSIGLVMLCSRTATRADGPITPDVPLVVPVQPARTADGDVILSVIDGAGFGKGPGRDAVREEIINRKLSQLADAWLAQLKADAIITRP